MHESNFFFSPKEANVEQTRRAAGVNNPPEDEAELRSRDSIRLVQQVFK